MSSLGPAGQAAIESGLRAGPARALELVCKIINQTDEKTGLPRIVFASIKWIADQLGVSKRTGFRYSSKLKGAGLWQRQPGDRHTAPRGATKPGKLKSHGYAITSPAPYLLELSRAAADTWRKRREEGKARKRQKHTDRKAEERGEAREWDRQYRPPSVDRPKAPSHRPFPPAPKPERVAPVPQSAFDALRDPPDSTAPE